MTTKTAMAVHTLPISILSAAAQATTQHAPTRYAMNCVEIRRTASGTLITATDGVMMVRLEARDAVDHEPSTVLVPAHAIELTAKRVNKLPKATRPNLVRITVEGEALTIVAVPAPDDDGVTEPVTMPVGTGYFPPCDQVEAPRRGTLIGLDADRLATLGRAMATAAGLSKRDGAPVLIWIPEPRAEGVPVRQGVRLEMHGVDGRATLMPLRLGDER
ncbi:MAG: hypothetical protein LC136_07745 [Burkholderiales bacterium]|nr:hypothetical protein [Burkholderiales bacterium]